MWNIEDKTGTVYTKYDTTLGNLLQHCYWYQSFISTYSDDLPYPYSNIKALLTNAINHSYRPVEEIDAHAHHDDHYCSLLTSDKSDNKYELIKSWCLSFDLMLHDAAVTYTYKAALHGGEDAQFYARVACDLWGYSRQLRQDMRMEKYNEQWQEVWDKAN